MEDEKQKQKIEAVFNENELPGKGKMEEEELSSRAACKDDEEENIGSGSDDREEEKISKENKSPDHPEEEEKEDKRPLLPLVFTSSDMSIKPRLKWNRLLHERFVEAVNELGGAFSSKLALLTYLSDHQCYPSYSIFPLCMLSVLLSSWFLPILLTHRSDTQVDNGKHGDPRIISFACQEPPAVNVATQKYRFRKIMNSKKDQPGVAIDGNLTSPAEEGLHAATSSSLPASAPKTRKALRSKNKRDILTSPLAILTERQMRYQVQKKFRARKAALDKYLGSLMQSAYRFRDDQTLGGSVINTIPQLPNQRDACPFDFPQANFALLSSRSTMLPMNLEGHPGKLPANNSILTQISSMPISLGEQSGVFAPKNSFSGQISMMSNGFEGVRFRPEIPCAFADSSPPQLSHYGPFDIALCPAIMDYLLSQNTMMPANLRVNPLNYQAQEKMMPLALEAENTYFQTQMGSYCSSENAAIPVGQETETSSQKEDHFSAHNCVLLRGSSAPEKKDDFCSVVGENKDTTENHEHEEDSEAAFQNWLAAGEMEDNCL
ncbi:hypothetical protein Nepgr_008976 [Nepenthes gracilis]|uniref:Uncharacterized protein n=1 Tax=Nepenthes gracilis TaxID=150966 RepID=A0AAD3SA27_NEPGR|nr:hypothetical protein Nepgr_008976 [Nepenthes gracilis]